MDVVDAFIVGFPAANNQLVLLGGDVDLIATEPSYCQIDAVMVFIDLDEVNGG
jgi:hypothetical protein